MSAVTAQLMMWRDKDERKNFRIGVVATGDETVAEIEIILYTETEDTETQMTIGPVLIPHLMDSGESIELPIDSGLIMVVVKYRERNMAYPDAIKAYPTWKLAAQGTFLGDGYYFRRGTVLRGGRSELFA
jgi:hypothetical protein